MHGLAYQHLQWAFTIIPQRLHRRVSFPNDIFSNNNLGVVVLTNTGFAGYHFVNAISNYVSDQWLGLSIIDWSARFKTVQAEAKTEKAKTDNEAKRKADTHPSHPADAYSGVYNHSAYGSITLEAQEDGYAGAFYGLSFRLRHYHYDDFEGTGTFDQSKFEFKIDAQGGIYRVVVGMANAGDIVFKKVSTSSK